MAELQVTFEVALDVDTVYNLDLFQKGWYQARFIFYINRLQLRFMPEKKLFFEFGSRSSAQIKIFEPRKAQNKHSQRKMLGVPNAPNWTKRKSRSICACLYSLSPRRTKIRSEKLKQKNFFHKNF